MVSADQLIDGFQVDIFNCLMKLIGVLFDEGFQVVFNFVAFVVVGYVEEGLHRIL
jgi:hypothetical protein